MAGVIDLRNPQGRFGGSFQAAADILTSIQRANKAKANRNTLNEISKARALNPDATIDEIIAGLPQTQDASGIAGFIQRITGAGQGDVLQQLQASRITTPVQEAQIKASEALATSRTIGKKTPPTQATPEEKDRDRNAAVIERELKKKNPRQGLIADATKRLLESKVLRQIETGGFDDAFQALIDELKPETTRRHKFLGIFPDKVFGQETFDELLESAVLEGLKDGIDPKSIEAALLEWWNRQFEKEKDQEFQKFAKIETGEPAGLEQSPEQIIQQAAEEGLLTPEDVESITAGLQADPSKLQDVLDLIERKRRGE